MSIIYSSCSGPKGIYVDIKEGAIISCDGKGMGEILIEDDSIKISLRSYKSIIYFNQKNIGLTAQSDTYGDFIMDYDFKLRAKVIYTITKYMGSDRGNFTATFKTDSLKRVIAASNTVCF